MVALVQQPRVWLLPRFLPSRSGSRVVGVGVVLAMRATGAPLALGGEPRQRWRWLELDDSAFLGLEFCDERPEELLDTRYVVESILLFIRMRVGLEIIFLCRHTVRLGQGEDEGEGDGDDAKLR